MPKKLHLPLLLGRGATQNAQSFFFWHLWQVNEDVRLVLAEITRVQKALQVDYLPPSKNLRSGQLNPFDDPTPRGI